MYGVQATLTSTVVTMRSSVFQNLMSDITECEVAGERHAI